MSLEVELRSWNGRPAQPISRGMLEASRGIVLRGDERDLGILMTSGALNVEEDTTHGPWDALISICKRKDI